ncbi:MAG: GH1 family beta-glucosidase [Pacificimonas sp.]
MRQFPEGFRFGASTASYQIEGAVEVDGRGESVWDRFSHTDGKIVTGETGDIACDHYNRWEEDLDLVAAAHMSVYRFSLAWPRLFPDGTGTQNEAGFDFYRRLIAGCHERGIEPWPCFYHWDMPQALMDRGGWTNRDSVQWYADYAEACATAFAADVPAMVLFNEPSVFTTLGYQLGYHAPGLTGLENFAPAMHHVNLATARGAERVRAAAPDVKLGNVLAWAHFEPAADAEDDHAAARWMDEHNNTGFADPFFKGSYPDGVRETLGDLIHDGDVEGMKTDFDFIGLNYYIHARCAMVDGRAKQLPPADGTPVSEMGWEHRPDSLTACLTRFRDLYGDMPLWVTENGMAAPDLIRDGDGRIEDTDRIAYLRNHIGAIHDAIDAGVDMRGYLIWTLIDNFEWAEGFRPKFGLVEMEPQSLDRKPKASFDWYAKLAQTLTLDA